MANAAIRAAPERRPITELGMASTPARMRRDLTWTIAGCPTSVTGRRRRARHFGGAGLTSDEQYPQELWRYPIPDPGVLPVRADKVHRHGQPAARPSAACQRRRPAAIPYLDDKAPPTGLPRLRSCRRPPSGEADSPVHPGQILGVAADAAPGALRVLWPTCWDAGPGRRPEPAIAISVAQLIPSTPNSQAQACRVANPPTHRRVEHVGAYAGRHHDAGVGDIPAGCRAAVDISTLQAGQQTWAYSWSCRLEDQP